MSTETLITDYDVSNVTFAVTDVIRRVKNRRRGIKWDIGVGDMFTTMELAAYAVCLVMILFGNTLTLIAIHKFRWLQTKSYIAMKLLTIADLCMSANIISVYILRFTDDKVKMVRNGMFYFQDLSVFTAIFHVVLVAFDRYAAIVYPFLYNTIITKTVLHVLSGIIWLIALLCPLLAGEFGRNMLFKPGGNVLFYLVDIMFYVLVATMMICLNASVALIARKQKRKIAAVDIPSEASGDTSKPK